MSVPCKKILAVSSGGGHWVQLQRLVPAFEGHEVVYVTVTAEYREKVSPCRLRVVTDATIWNKFKLLQLAAEMFWVVFRERPDVVVSTGAAPGFFALWFGKRFGAKTIWVDSIANVEHLSLSGRKVRPYADLWLTQWPHLAGPEGPEYRGAVL